MTDGHESPDAYGSMEILGPVLLAAVALVKGEAPPDDINDPSWATDFEMGRERTQRRSSILLV